MKTKIRLAVLVPCYNEEVTIGKVVGDFRRALPDSEIYVYDNNSSDRTAEVARKHGGIVMEETLQGKGNVVRRMFADVEADVYVLVDGDDTYDAASAGKLVDRLVFENLDMVNAARTSQSEESYRPGHRFGNVLLTGIVAWIFGSRFTDMLSGYRVFSRRFVKCFPALTTGFEIETELTIHALELRMPVAEMRTPYKERPKGSVSKLNTFSDGFRILFTILRLVKAERPMRFFSFIAAVAVAASLTFAYPVFVQYIQIGLVPRLPTAILATGLMILAALSLVCGLVLETVTQGRMELKRLHYLNLPAPLAVFSGPERRALPTVQDADRGIFGN